MSRSYQDIGKTAKMPWCDFAKIMIFRKSSERDTANADIDVPMQFEHKTGDFDAIFAVLLQKVQSIEPTSQDVCTQKTFRNCAVIHIFTVFNRISRPSFFLKISSRFSLYVARLKISDKI